MAIITKTDVVGTVTATLTHGGSETDISSDPSDGLVLTFDGIVGDSHAGATRPSDVRVRRQYVEGTTIRNVRQLTVVAEEELAIIASAMGIENIEPAWLGANVAVVGIPDFTLIPPSTRLIFSSGASLVVDAENEPCVWPAKQIDARHEGKGTLFVKNAANRRGITAWVEREGAIKVGDTIEVHIPPQRIWTPGT